MDDDAVLVGFLSREGISKNGHEKKIERWFSKHPNLPDVDCTVNLAASLADAELLLRDVTSGGRAPFHMRGFEEVMPEILLSRQHAPAQGVPHPLPAVAMSDSGAAGASSNACGAAAAALQHTGGGCAHAVGSAPAAAGGLNAAEELISAGDAAVAAAMQQLLQMIGAAHGQRGWAATQARNKARDMVTQLGLMRLRTVELQKELELERMIDPTPQQVDEALAAAKVEMRRCAHTADAPIPRLHLTPHMPASAFAPQPPWLFLSQRTAHARGATWHPLPAPLARSHLPVVPQPALVHGT